MCLRWHDAIRLLEEAPVVIPYATRIRFPTKQVRIRRDARRLLDVIRVHAWLHQHSRQRDDQSRILATEDDFQAALRLVADSLKRAWQSLTPSEEKVLAAILALPEQKRRVGFKRADLDLPGMPESTIKDALRSMERTGYLDSDGARGKAGRTYMLVRTPDETALGILLVHSSIEEKTQIEPGLTKDEAEPSILGHSSYLGGQSAGDGRTDGDGRTGIVHSNPTQHLDLHLNGRTTYERDRPAGTAATGRASGCGGRVWRATWLRGCVRS